MESKVDRKPSFSGDSRSEKKAYPTSAHDYELLQEIGRGGTATVHRAKCIPLNEYVAVKVLDLDRCFGTMDEVQKEAKTMSLINHPNVVKAHCSFVVEHFLWVVMPYMGCGSCLHIMKAAFPDGFEEPIIAYFLKETLKALEYLHQHGHIHRDVKAGNILVDSNGVIKLGDFGVSACMFDTGDRQRTRSTFIGTPCWMAPEVMEERPRYDYKADVWSFGITALELAHGHAPFSKYPPMKVLLMTLQNAPPALDYERDKRFSKSFKEMVAMCLVKDPTKRPSAEKLLKHSFFKNAKSADYVVRSILEPLPPLWQLVSDLQVKEEVRVAKKQIPYGEEEVKSQNEYKRGVSCWTFDLEDLKAQAALNEAEPSASKEGQSVSMPKLDSVAAELNRASSPPSPQGLLQEPKSSKPQTRSDVEEGTDAEEHVTRVRPGQSSPPHPTITGSKPLSDTKSVPTGKKEPKHFGRFDVFDDDPDPEVKGPCSDKGDKPKEQKKDRVGQDEGGKNRGDGDDKGRNLELKQPNDRVCEESSSVECSASLHGEERVTKFSTSQSNEDLIAVQPSKPKGSGGPLTSAAATPLESQLSNGGAGLSRSAAGIDYKASKNVSEEKQKSQAVFQKKGRFSVTSQDSDPQQEASNARKNASVQTSLPPPVLHKSATMGDERKTAPSPASASTGVMSAAMVIPQLQTLFNQTALQQDLILNLMNSINPLDQHTGHRSNSFITRNASKGSSSSLVEPMGDLSAERERDLLVQVAELQCRVTTLVEELQAVKSRNGQLERQLNAIFNRDQEERIRKEEAAKEDG